MKRCILLSCVRPETGAAGAALYQHISCVTSVFPGTPRLQPCVRIGPSTLPDAGLMLKAQSREILLAHVAE